MDRLLASESFHRQQVAEFIWLLNNGRDDGFRGYLEKAFADSRTWNKLFEEIILARADTDAVKGAEKFYRRKDPGFVAENAEVMGFILTIILLCWSTLSWVREWYTQNRKNKIDTYYQAVDDVIRRLHDGTDLKEIDELEGDLLKIRTRSSADLVNEQLDANESYIIYQNMLNGCQSMLLRMREKIQASSKENA